MVGHENFENKGLTPLPVHPPSHSSNGQTSKTIEWSAVGVQFLCDLNSRY